MSRPCSGDLTLLEIKMNVELIIGRNPVTEALKSGRTIEKLVVMKGSEKTLSNLVAMAKDRGVPVYYNDKQRMERLAEGGAHQGVAAYVSSYEYCEVEDILQRAKDKGEDPFIIVLDGIEDPHNLGAIMRSADGAGAHGIIIPKRRAVGVTGVVAKASAGAIEYVPVARVANISQTLEKLKKDGFWVAAVDMSDTLYYKADLKGSLALVIGNEGEGISKLVKQNCDFTVSIPMCGRVQSLNASNAAAIIMYEVRRQRENG